MRSFCIIISSYSITFKCLNLSLSNGIKKKKQGLLEAVKSSNTKISFLSEEVGQHNLERMREHYKKPEISGQSYFERYFN